MEQTIKFEPARGAHGADMFFILKGDKGAISFTVFTNWKSESFKNSLSNDREYHALDLCAPMAEGFYYHSFIRLDEEDNLKDDCDFIDNTCFSQSIYSLTYSDKVLQDLIDKGSTPVWEAMTEIYNFVFERASE